MTHNDRHPQAGQTVKVQFKGGHFQIPGSEHSPVEFRIEDWWDHLTGGSWMFADGNPAAMIYGLRGGIAGLPTDDEVIYGKVGHLGHLIHTSELICPGAWDGVVGATDPCEICGKTVYEHLTPEQASFDTRVDD